MKQDCFIRLINHLRFLIYEFLYYDISFIFTMIQGHFMIKVYYMRFRQQVVIIAFF